MEPKEKPAQSDLFESAAMESENPGDDKKEDRKKQFLGVLSEDDIKRRHYDNQEDLRKQKRYFE